MQEPLAILSAITGFPGFSGLRVDPVVTAPCDAFEPGSFLAGAAVVMAAFAANTDKIHGFRIMLFKPKHHIRLISAHIHSPFFCVRSPVSPPGLAGSIFPSLIELPQN
ncbi:MAG: hypothetical protein ACI3VA_13440 [Candidatus Limivicinus sp.]